MVWDSDLRTNIFGYDQPSLTGSGEPLPTAGRFSDNGRFLAFLKTGALGAFTNLYNQLVVCDLWSNTTNLVSFTGTQKAASDLDYFAMTADASAFAVHGRETNAVAHDNNSSSDVFYQEIFSGSVRLVSARHSNAVPSRPRGLSFCKTQSTTEDGAYTVYVSDSNNLATNDLNDFRDVLIDCSAGFEVAAIP